MFAASKMWTDLIKYFKLFNCFEVMWKCTRDVCPSSSIFDKVFIVCMLSCLSLKTKRLALADCDSKSLKFTISYSMGSYLVSSSNFIKSWRLLLSIVFAIYFCQDLLFLFKDCRPFFKEVEIFYNGPNLPWLEFRAFSTLSGWLKASRIILFLVSN